MVTPIVNDITFNDYYKKTYYMVFCDHLTGTMHLNSNYQGVCYSDDATHHEKNMVSIITHETIHLILADVDNWLTSCKWDVVDRNGVVSDSLERSVIKCVTQK